MSLLRGELREAPERGLREKYIVLGAAGVRPPLLLPWPTDCS